MSTNWMPIANEKRLRVHGKKEIISIMITDRRLGKIDYHSDSIEMTGVDLRVFGEEIQYKNGDSIVIMKTESEPKQGNSASPYELVVEGNGIAVKDVRTSDVERITITAKKKLKAVVEPIEQSVKKEPKRRGANGIIGLWGLGVLLVVEIVALAALTGLPFWQFVSIRGKYLDDVLGIAKTNEVAAVSCPCAPLAVTNTLTMQTSYKTIPDANASTNSACNTVTSVSTTPDSLARSKCNEKPGAFGAKLLLVVGCLLYVAFYGVITYLTSCTLKALGKRSKLTRDMSGVLEALRSERDKEKRKAMQKKILDDMIDLYIDKQSSED